MLCLMKLYISARIPLLDIHKMFVYLEKFGHSLDFGVVSYDASVSDSERNSLFTEEHANRIIGSDIFIFFPTNHHEESVEVGVALGKNTLSGYPLIYSVLLPDTYHPKNVHPVIKQIIAQDNMVALEKILSDYSLRQLSDNSILYSLSRHVPLSRV